MKQAYLYCDPRSLNDATIYYVGLMTSPLKSNGYQFKTVHNLSQISYPDLIITITEKYFFFAKLRFPFAKTIYWAQGVDAEETKMSIHTFKQRLRYCFRRFTEPIAINKADILMCVSDRMVEYYQDNYGLKDHGQIIVMPCYNLSLSETFDTKQYEAPVFAYAGNTSVWQGVDFMLDVYALVEKRLPNTSLKLFSGNKDEFIQKCKDRGITNFELRYVPVNQLQEELHKCKYGFIIRNNHIVNLVATPTKMNSYLAAYMIPIFSDGVDDFNKNVQLGEYRLMINCPLDAENAAQKIIDFEKNHKDFSSYQKVVQKMFDRHYNDQKYLEIISNKMKMFIIRQ